MRRAAVGRARDAWAELTLQHYAHTLTNLVVYRTMSLFGRLRDAWAEFTLQHHAHTLRNLVVRRTISLSGRLRDAWAALTLMFQYRSIHMRIDLVLYLLGFIIVCVR